MPGKGGGELSDEIQTLVYDFIVRVGYIIEGIISEETDRMRTILSEKRTPPTPLPSAPAVSDLFDISDSEPEPERIIIVPTKVRDDEPTEKDPPPVRLPVIQEVRFPDKVDWDTIPDKRALRFEDRLFAPQVDKTFALHDRPRTRGDCQDQPRPCPWVSCQHHLAIDVTDIGTLMVIKNWDDGRPTCSIDVAEQTGGMTLDDVGRIIGVSRERVRQIELAAFHRAKASDIELEDFPEHREHPW